MIKNLIKKVCSYLSIDLTQNMKYDRLTTIILKSSLKPTSSCIDVGCHKGEILDVMLKNAPLGNHVGFEPIPSFYTKLKEKYSDKATIYPYALSDSDGESTFYHVTNDPAYSGLKKRKYDIKNPRLEKIYVVKKRLDDILLKSSLSKNQKIDLIKIDVEGGEYDVIKGAKKTIRSFGPMILFECGKSSEAYDASSLKIFNILTENLGYDIYTLANYLKKESKLNFESFDYYYSTGKEYYFMAIPAL